MHAARLIYAQIGESLRKQGLDSVNQRAFVGGWEKSLLLGAAIAAACRPVESLAGEGVDEGRFLVEAVPMEAAPPLAGDRIVWLLDLFERLERQQLERQSVAGR
jgi:phytoene synthase